MHNNKIRFHFYDFQAIVFPKPTLSPGTYFSRSKLQVEGSGLAVSGASCRGYNACYLPQTPPQI